MTVSWYKNTTTCIGTSGKPLTFDNETNSSSPHPFLSELGVEKLGVISQVHGNEIIDLDFENLTTQESEQVTNFGTADGIIIRNIPPIHKRTNFFALGIRTADCLPIIIEAGSNIALLHAGWRGLASKIIESSFNKLNIGSVSQCYVWIGPAAKKCCYEVGTEVIEALSISLEDSREQKRKIDLQEQALLQVNLLTPFANIEIDRRCTICDPKLHSFRANNTKHRNLSFVVL